MQIPVVPNVYYNIYGYGCPIDILTWLSWVGSSDLYSQSSDMVTLVIGSYGPLVIEVMNIRGSLDLEQSLIKTKMRDIQ